MANATRGLDQPGPPGVNPRSGEALDFAGMLDDMDGNIRVDILGIPIPDSYETSAQTDQSTSQGKVAEVFNLSTNDSD